MVVISKYVSAQVYPEKTRVQEAQPAKVPTLRRQEAFYEKETVRNAYKEADSRHDRSQEAGYNAVSLRSGGEHVGHSDTRTCNSSINCDSYGIHCTLRHMDAHRKGN